MSRRPGEWHLLGRGGGDPVPGSPSSVERLANGYERTADEVARLSGRLRRLAALDGWTGQAAERFAESAEDLAEDLADAERRSRGVGTALRGFVEPLRTARDRSRQLVAQAEQAEQERRRTADDPLAGVLEPTEGQIAAASAQAQRHSAAVRRLREAGEGLDAVLAELDAAAGRTERALRSAAERGRDSWWDNRKGDVRGIAEGLKVVVDVLSVLAVALAVLTLVALVVFTAPISVFVVAGVAIGLTSLTANSLLVLSESGEATWTDVGTDVLGLAATLVGGRLAVSAARSLSSARAGIAGRVGQQARANRLQQLRSTPEGRSAANAGKIEDPRNGLRRWSDDTMAGFARRADTAADTARGGVLRTAPSRPLDRVTHLDHDLAESAADLRRLRARTDLTAGERASLAGVRSDLVQARRVNVAGLGVQSGDVVDTGGSTGVLPSGAAWKGSFDDSASRTLWRLSR